MLRIVRRIMRLAGEYSGRLKAAMAASFFEGIFVVSPVILVLFALHKILSGSLSLSDRFLFAGLVLLSILFRILFRRLADGLMMGTGYKIFARERMKLGEHLKRLPMGYFTGGSAGNISAVISSDIIFIEQHAMTTLSKIVNAYIAMALGSVMLLLFDYRIGLIAVISIALAAMVLGKLNRVSTEQAEKRQEGQSRLISGVLEYVQGISVIKAFQLSGDREQRVDQQFKEYRDISIEFEKEIVPTFKRFHSCFAAGISLIILTAGYLGLIGSIDITFMLMIVVYIFQFFIPLEALSTAAPLARIMDRAMDRYEEVLNAQIIDSDGVDIPLKQFDIHFDKVSFAYEQETVLRDLSFHVPERSMTALVGKSGCGKTTITNLIARFWDVEKGTISIGGVDIRRMSCDSLLRHISMVFQDVYLFHDTILNNIRFGKPDASMEEVIEACKKARCHDFITALDQGYGTMVEEGGSSLSGGEKQRISIARAILKDAPIVLLDEATASVDPDNEKHLQDAIDELVKEKTLVLIAHKLSTVRNADQILVLDQGQLVQRGTHESLSAEKGIYRDFWERRAKARSWKISRRQEPAGVRG